MVRCIELLCFAIVAWRWRVCIGCMVDDTPRSQPVFFPQMRLPT